MSLQWTNTLGAAQWVWAVFSPFGGDLESRVVLIVRPNELFSDVVAVRALVPAGCEIGLVVRYFEEPSFGVVKATLEEIHCAQLLRRARLEELTVLALWKPEDGANIAWKTKPLVAHVTDGSLTEVVHGPAGRSTVPCVRFPAVCRMTLQTVLHGPNLDQEMRRFCSQLRSSRVMFKLPDFKAIRGDDLSGAGSSQRLDKLPIFSRAVETLRAEWSKSVEAAKERIAEFTGFQAASKGKGRRRKRKQAAANSRVEEKEQKEEEEEDCGGTYLRHFPPFLPQTTVRRLTVSRGVSLSSVAVPVVCFVGGPPEEAKAAEGMSLDEITATPLRLDVVGLFDPSQTVNHTVNSLVATAESQLAMFEQQLDENNNGCMYAALLQPQTLCVRQQGCGVLCEAREALGCPVTFCGLWEEASGRPLRSTVEFKAGLGLPSNQPLSIAALCSREKIEEKKNEEEEEDEDEEEEKQMEVCLHDKLVDVHCTLGVPQGVSGGRLSVVSGSCAYYHYHHDGFNDEGWGCAYRTLQTICSFFVLNGYKGAVVPSHVAIQRSLVRLGDKKRSFVGSSEWIGAFELGMVLGELCGITASTMHVPDGGKISAHVRSLLHHFDTEGSPVMIGGALWSYGLLGVYFNEASGDCRFLILDPHYTGSDTPKDVLTSGYCAWKTPEQVFKPKTFYNFCLPKRPQTL